MLFILQIMFYSSMFHENDCMTYRRKLRSRNRTLTLMSLHIWGCEYISMSFVIYIEHEKRRLSIMSTVINEWFWTKQQATFRQVDIQWMLLIIHLFFYSFYFEILFNKLTVIGWIIYYKSIQNKCTKKWMISCIDVLHPKCVIICFLLHFYVWYPCTIYEDSFL